MNRTTFYTPQLEFHLMRLRGKAGDLGALDRVVSAKIQRPVRGRLSEFIWI